MHTSDIWVIGNWKMNPATIADAKVLFNSAKKAAKQQSQVKVAIAAPYVYVSDLQKIAKGSNVSLAAQNIHETALGAHTGEVSALMLRQYGVESVIIGHSERRAAGETDAKIAEKITVAFKNKLQPIICIGETARDNDAEFYSVVEAQIKAVLSSIPKTRFKEIIFAYEPVWAIGTGLTASPADIEEMRLYIQKVLTNEVNRQTALKTTIIYGGSVNKDNAASILKETGMQGFLVGGASLKANDFAAIIEAAGNK